LNIGSCHLVAYGGTGVAIIAEGKTLKLELKPEIEAGLLAQAHARGLSLEAYLDEVLKSAAATKPRPASRKSLAQLFAESPLKGLDLKFERDQDMGRPVKL
jgi:hypothetical protein